MSSASRLSRMSASSSTIRMRPLDLLEAGMSGGNVSGMNRFARERNLDQEAGASAGLALHFDRSSMLPHYSIGYRQTEPRAFFRSLGREKRVEHARQISSGDSLPCIQDLDIGQRIVVPGMYRERAARLHRVARVQKQIQNARDAMEAGGTLSVH